MPSMGIRCHYMLMGTSRAIYWKYLPIYEDSRQCSVAKAVALYSSVGQRNYMEFNNLSISLDRFSYFSRWCTCWSFHIFTGTKLLSEYLQSYYRISYFFKMQCKFNICNSLHYLVTEHLPHYWPIEQRIHWSTGHQWLPHTKDQYCRALIMSLLLALLNK